MVIIERNTAKKQEHSSSIQAINQKTAYRIVNVDGISYLQYCKQTEFLFWTFSTWDYIQCIGNSPFQKRLLDCVNDSNYGCHNFINRYPFIQNYFNEERIELKYKWELLE